MTLDTRALNVASTVVLILAPTVAHCQAAHFGEVVASVGKFDGPDHETFGWITDAVVGPERSFFVADLQKPGVMWFGPDGAFRDMVASRGRGPGELRSPWSISVDQDGVLHVLDIGNNRISKYSTSGNRLQHQSDVRITAGSPQDFCMVEGRTFVLTRNPAGLVMEVGADGTPVAEFGAAIEPEATRRLSHALPALRVRYNAGILECDAESGRVLLIHAQLGIIRAFTLNGDSIWVRTLPDFKLSKWTADSDGRISSFGSQSETVHEVTSVAKAPGLLLLTLWEGGPASLEGELELRVLRLADGAELGRMPAPGRISSLDGERALMHSRYPFGTVTMRAATVR